MSMEIVSIVVLTYNSSRYVIETLDSIYRQSYRNIELIICDDCSTDTTYKLCEEWLRRHADRFVNSHIIQQHVNGGVANNCNSGNKIARGTYVKFIAGDDYLVEDYVDKCVKKFNEVPDCGMVYTLSYLVLEKQKKIIEENSSQYKKGYLFDDLCRLNFWPKTPSIIFRKKVVDEMGGFDTSIWVEDYLLVLKVADKYPIEYIPDYLAFYRLHSNNIGSETIRLVLAHIETIKRFKDKPIYWEAIKIHHKRLYKTAYKERPVFLLVYAFKKCDVRALGWYVKSIFVRIYKKMKNALNNNN